MAGKSIIIAGILLSFFVPNNITFAYLQTQWIANTGDGEWCNPDNWSCTGDPHPITCVPDCDWIATILPTLVGPNITDGPCWWGNGSCCVGLYVHAWSWTYAPPKSEVNISLNTGSFDCGYMIGISNLGASDGYGVINMYGGTVLTSLATGNNDGLAIGKSVPSYGLLNIYGGLMTVPRIAVYYGVANLYGGVLQNTSGSSANFFISNQYSMNKINVAGGTLRLAGNRINEVYASSRIEPYENRGHLVVDYNVSTPGYTTVAATYDLGIAWNPNPANGQTNVSLTPTLTWTAGDYVQDVNEHRVYFGTSFADVNDANVSNPLGVYQGSRDVNNFVPTGPLDANKIYYWRIDEVNDANTDSPWKGSVWQFTTQLCPLGGTVFTGNLNDDCIVNLYDLKIMCQEWLTAGVSADIYPAIPDGIVNFSDFAILAKNWLVEEY